jgi:hypothetical protein
MTKTIQMKISPNQLQEFQKDLKRYGIKFYPFRKVGNEY